MVVGKFSRCFVRRPFNEILKQTFFHYQLMMETILIHDNNNNYNNNNNNNNNNNYIIIIIIIILVKKLLTYQCSVVLERIISEFSLKGSAS